MLRSRADESLKRYIFKKRKKILWLRDILEGIGVGPVIASAFLWVTQHERLHGFLMNSQDRVVCEANAGLVV